MTRDIIIGDIHGCFEELQTLLEAAKVTARDRIIAAGDIVDRGPDSPLVWSFLRDRPNTVVISGNHERKHVRGPLSLSQEIVKLQFGPTYAEFQAWAAKLPYFFETEHCLVVHGGFEPGVPLTEQREEVLCSTMSGAKRLHRSLGGRDWAAVVRQAKPIVFGHRIVGDEAVRWDGAWGIDTGACHGGYLTALLTPGFECVRVRARADHWSRERRIWEPRVLAQRPWSTFRFAKLERELAQLESRRSASGRALARTLRAWLRKLDARIPDLIGHIRTARTELGTRFEGKALQRAIANHRHAPLLFAADNLDPTTVRAQLQTPDALVQALVDFRITTPGFPELGATKSHNVR